MQDQTDTRLQHLESQVRRLRLTLAFALTLVVAFLAVAAHRPIPDELVAHSIRVTGDNGANSAVLGATSDGFVSLSFRDLKGRQTFSILMTPSGKPSIVMSDGTVARVLMGAIPVDHQDAWSFRLLDATGTEAWRPQVKNAVTN